MQNYDLARFVTAQNGVFGYDRALAEIRAGRKQSHWMWYIFPQLTGLGRSETARFYGIRDLGEAAAYLDDFTFSEEEFYQTDQRLDLINHLKTKYGNSVTRI